MSDRRRLLVAWAIIALCAAFVAAFVAGALLALLS